MADEYEEGLDDIECDMMASRGNALLYGDSDRFDCRKAMEGLAKVGLGEAAERFTKLLGEEESNRKYFEELPRI
jgi:hypothetical protein